MEKDRSNHCTHRNASAHVAEESQQHAAGSRPLSKVPQQLLYIKIFVTCRRTPLQAMKHVFFYVWVFYDLLLQRLFPPWLPREGWVRIPQQQTPLCVMRPWCLGINRHHSRMIAASSFERPPCGDRSPGNLLCCTEIDFVPTLQKFMNRYILPFLTLDFTDFFSHGVLLSPTLNFTAAFSDGMLTFSH